ncbi:MAG: hypothetical protein GWP91_16585 [Rhodobacterales bacterium]|nr:hypothetical protein [Rhodobacterales bacterium]
MNRFLFALVCGSVVASAAQAATLSVPSVYPTLASAVVAAAAGDTIEIASDTNEPLVTVDKSVLITTDGSGGLVTIPAVLVVNASSVSISGLRIPCTLDTPGVEVELLSSVTLDNVDTALCTSFYSRVFGNAGGDVSILNSTFSNLDSASGAAVKVQGLSLLNIENSLFQNNNGGLAVGSDCVGTPCTGALDLGLLAEVTITDSFFESNTGVFGGAIKARSPVLFNLTNVSFADNIADEGAALWLDQLVVGTFTDVTVTGSFTTNGAAVLIEGADLTTSDLIFERFHASDNERSGGVGPAVIDARQVDNLEIYSAWFCGSIGEDIRLAEGSFLDLQGAVLAFTEAQSSVHSAASTAELTNISFVHPSQHAVWGDGTLGSTSISTENTLFYEVLNDPIANGTLISIFDIYGTAFNGSFASLSNSYDLVTGILDSVDPMLQEPVTDCQDSNYWLSAASPYRNAGEPSILNQDGSVSDVGAYGGPWAWLVDGDGDGFYEDLDCDDADSTSFPGATEIPNDNIDQDCDGFDVVDADNDGFVSDVSGGTDCDDNNAAVYPGAYEEPYNNVDEDCDGVELWDVDNDNFDGPSLTGDDCNDADPSVHPNAPEVWYDGVDQNCDELDDYDQDGDGEVSDQHGGPDCDDLDATVHTAATEIWYDGVDQDCDGLNDYDQDGDGENIDGVGGADCDDTDPTRAPGFEDLPYGGIDQDCDGKDVTDADGDGAAGEAIGGDDCDDTDPTVFPGAPEDFSSVDRNCDGWTDPVGDVSPVGCSSSTTQTSGWLVFLILPLLFSRRETRLEAK